MSCLKCFHCKQIENESGEHDYKCTLFDSLLFFNYDNRGIYFIELPPEAIRATPTYCTKIKRRKLDDNKN